MAKKAKATTKTKRESSSNGNSNTGLIVTLIFFVVATLTLGVFTYFGYTGQTELIEKANKATKETATAKKATDDALARKIVLAIASGNATPEDESKLKDVKGTEGFKATVEMLTKGTGLAWDANQDRPKETYRELINKLTTERDQAVKAKVDATTAFNEAKAQFDSMTTSYKGQSDKAKEDLKNAETKHVAMQQKDHEWYDSQIKRIDTESNQLKAEKEAHQTDIKNAEMDQKKLEAQKEDQAKQLAFVRAQIAPPNSLEADTPKGSILRVDRQNKSVYINIGSADYARPNVAFSILPPSSTGKSAANAGPAKSNAAPANPTIIPKIVGVCSRSPPGIIASIPTSQFGEN